MSIRLTQQILTAATMTLALVGLLPSTLSAQESQSAEIVVGTYEPQQVAEAAGFQERMMAGMQGLQQRMQQAQQEGDQQAMQQIQVEAQQIEQDIAGQFLAEIEAVMPRVAEETGATIITTTVSYAAEGVATEDVTQAVIAAMESEAAPAE